MIASMTRAQFLRQLDQQFAALRQMPKPIPVQERHRYSVEQGISAVSAGEFLKIGDALYRVSDENHYAEGRDRWHELVLYCIQTGETTYLEWEKDDVVELDLTIRAVSLKELGVRADTIEEMSEEEEGEIRFDGRTFLYEDDYRAYFSRGASSDREEVYVYEFEAADGALRLTVEEWGDDKSGYDYEAFISRPLEHHEVEFIALASSDT